MTAAKLVLVLVCRKFDHPFTEFNQVVAETKEPQVQRRHLGFQVMPKIIGPR